MSDSYDDIIHLPRHVSAVHTPMPMRSRAAQFAPFAALEGHDDAIMETGRYVDERIIPSQEEEAVIFSRLTYIATQAPDATVRIKYFVADAKKAGGVCRDVTGTIRKIDEVQKEILMDGGIRISFTDILEIDSRCFDI